MVIDEAGGTSTVTVKTGDVTFADDQTITLGLSGTATEGDDYTVTKELTLDAGASSVTTTVTAVQDTFDDDGETIGIKAKHGHGAPSSESAEQTVTIRELTLDAGESSVTTTVTAVQDTYDDDGETIEIKARHGVGTESEVQRITITDDDELALTVELSDAVIGRLVGRRR